MAAPKQFTLAQVKQHSKAHDLWLVIHDKVYDVSKFASEHPGGSEVLLEAGGRDASKDFDDVGHSDAAIDMLGHYYLGDVVDAEKKEKKGCCFGRLLCNNKKQLVCGASSALAAGIGAFLIYQGYKVLKN